MPHYPLHQPRKRLNGFIYLIEHQFAFKVGFSQHPQKRLLGLQTSNYLPLQLTGFFEAAIEDELAFHLAFKTYSLGNEWYPVVVRQLALEYLRNIDVDLRVDLPNPKKAAKVSTLPQKVFTEAEKRDYIKACVNIKDLLNPGVRWSKYSSQIASLVKFGKRKKSVEALGYRVPKITKGKRKGEYDGIRYLRQIIALFGYQLSSVIKEKQSGHRFNSYHVIKL